MDFPTTSRPAVDPGFQFYDKQRSEACLRGFHALYEQKLLCDVTLVAQGKDFPCHRAMLAASSPYFQGIDLPLATRRLIFALKVTGEWSDQKRALSELDENDDVGYYRELARHRPSNPEEASEYIVENGDLIEDIIIIDEANWIDCHPEGKKKMLSSFLAQVLVMRLIRLVEENTLTALLIDIPEKKGNEMEEKKEEETVVEDEILDEPAPREPVPEEHLPEASKIEAMFGGHFTERMTSKVTLNEITSSTLRILLQYLYSGKLVIEEESVQLLFTAAHMLQLTDLEELCASFMMQRITEKNCLGVYFFAKNYNRKELKNRACHKMCSKFNKVTRAQEFLALPAEAAAEVLSFSNITHVCEEDVYAAAIRWLENDLPDRQADIFKVMQSVRFIHMDERFFREKVKCKSLFRNCRQLQALFEQVIYYINHPYRWHEVDVILEPRKGEKYQYPRPILYTVRNIFNGSTALEAYMTEQPEFRKLPVSLPADEELKNPTMAVMDDVYLAGGTGSYPRALYKFDVRFTGRVMRMAKMHHARSHFSFVPVDRFLYVVGGCHKNTSTDSVEKYIIEKNQWIKVAPLPCRLRCMAAVSYRGKLYVFGGELQTKIKGNKSRFLSNHAFMYDPEKDRWKTLRPMKSARALAGCAVYRNKIYVIGGMGAMSEAWEKDGEPHHCLNTCEVFDPAVNLWTVGPPLPKAMCAVGVVKYYGTICLLGGLHNGEPVRDVYVLNSGSSSTSSGANSGACGGGTGAGGGGGGGGESWVAASLCLSHGSLLQITTHSAYLPVSLRDYICGEHSETESESTAFGGASMDATGFDLQDDSSDSSDGSLQEGEGSYFRWAPAVANQAGFDSSSSRSSLSLNVFDNS